MAPHRSSKTLELAAPQLQLATQLQGLHQLHIQLESIVAYLEGREPHNVPVFGEYATSGSAAFSIDASPRPLTSSSEPSTQQAENLVSALLGQLSEIKRDFGQLKTEYAQPHDNSNDSYLTSTATEYDPHDDSQRQLQYSQNQLVLSETQSPELSLERDDSTSVESIEDGDLSPLAAGDVRLLQDVEGIRGAKNSEKKNEQLAFFVDAGQGQGSDQHAPVFLQGTSAASTNISTMTNTGRGSEESISADHDSEWENITPAKCKLLVVQARRQVEARGREVSRLQGLVRNLEAQLLKNAAPAAVMAQAAVLQKRNSNLEEQLRESRAETAAAKAQIVGLQQAQSRAQETMAAATEPAAAAVQEAERLRKRVTVLEAQNSKLRAVVEEKKARGNGWASSEGHSARSSMGHQHQHATSSPEAGFLTKNSDANFSSSFSSDHLSSGFSYPPGSNLQTPHFYHLDNGTAIGTGAPGSQHPPPHDNLALEKWHEGKKLQKRIENLQIKLKEQSDVAAAATSAKISLQAHVTRVTADLAKSQATMSSLRTQLQRHEGIDGKLGGNVPAHTVQALLQELEALQGRYDVLERQLALAKTNHPEPSSSDAIATSPHYNQDRSITSRTSPSNTALVRHAYTPGRYADTKADADAGIQDTIQRQRVAADLKILDLELERDQATARAARLQQRLDLLLTELGQESTGLGQASKSGGKGRRGNKDTVRTQREQELVDTVALLRAALEKTRKGLENGVSSAKYMQAVEKAKQAASRVKELEAIQGEVEEQRQRASTAQREVADLQVVISALRGQLRDAKRKTKESSSARDEIMNAQVAELERAVRERDTQIAALMHSACEEARALVAEGLTPKMLVHQLLAAR